MKRISIILFGAILGMAFMPNGKAFAQEKTDKVETGTVVVNISGIQPERRRDKHCKAGNPAKLIVLLFNKEKSWENDKAGWKKRVRAVKTKNTTVKFKYVTPGDTYAVWVIHDIECDGGFTMRWLPIPSPFDGVAASWKPEIKDTNRRPKWKHVNFAVKPGETKTFNAKMVYNLKWKG